MVAEIDNNALKIKNKEAENWQKIKNSQPQLKIYGFLYCEKKCILVTTPSPGQTKQGGTKIDWTFANYAQFKNSVFMSKKETYICKARCSVS